ncbi:MAG TPA: Hsp20/alpha crystallin family protein [Syntrophomonadaceae bacterium]|nr:Hsp20/alpha crystallin family protein [Syntrophomonadaceae bacterium]
MSHKEASQTNDYREYDMDRGNQQGQEQTPSGVPSSYPGAAPGFFNYQLQMFAWQPRIDIFEDHDNILIVVEVPGVKPEQVNVEVGNNILIVRGETPIGSKMPPRYRERTPGTFFRQIPLPLQLDLDRAEASCRDGLLRITIPKEQIQQQQGKNIPVKH